ncbi:unnamed protein product [Larinioides sclopetarius]|uniref:Uncharacterized protein n=1 Tax=Larinioides sclopetarius TaxID=280406 RepID=A0AAV2BT51_9ARAC
MDLMHVVSNTPTCDFFGGSHWSVFPGDKQTLNIIGCSLSAVTSYPPIAFLIDISVHQNETYALYFVFVKTIMMVVVLCFAAVVYVAMADDKPQVMTMVGKPLYYAKVTDSDGNTHFEQREG